MVLIRPCLCGGGGDYQSQWIFPRSSILADRYPIYSAWGTTAPHAVQIESNLNRILKKGFSKIGLVESPLFCSKVFSPMAL